VVEGDAFRRALQLDEAAAAGHHHVHVHAGGGILGVAQVEHGVGADDAHTGRGHEVAQRQRGQDALPPQCAQRLHEYHEAAGDGRTARAAVGLHHVAVDDDGPLPEPGEVHDRPQAAADEPLDLLRAAAEPALDRLPLNPLGAGARQHPVFGGHPARPAVAQKRRDFVLDGRGADHPRVAPLDEAGGVGELHHPARQLDRPQLAGCAAVGPASAH
jgi:hypothetical protein